MEASIIPAGNGAISLVMATASQPDPVIAADCVAICEGRRCKIQALWIASLDRTPAPAAQLVPLIQRILPSCFYEYLKFFVLKTICYFCIIENNPIAGY